MSAILQLFPGLLDVNGDSQNALVLAQRATWAGLDAPLVAVAPGEAVPAAAPAVVVIGSCVDSDRDALRVALAPFEQPLREWADAGVPILGVGTGLEALSEEGIGLLPGRPVERSERATGDLVVDSEVGRLVGFENHARGYLLPVDARAVGRVVRGVGNDGLSEGVRSGSVWGTHLHGPVLAKNPALADALLIAAFGERAKADDPRIRFVDDLAAAARGATTARLGV